MKNEKIGSYRQELEGIRHPDHCSKILVQIVSYCDTELKNTILALRGMAADPERIHIGVCAQGDDPSLVEWLEKLPDTCLKYYSREEAPGTCGARYDCNQMLKDEDFVLHLDSHMRFARHWDLMLIDQLRRCGEEKALLSGYCMRYNEYFDEPWDSDVFTDQAQCRAIIETVDGYLGDGITPFLQGAVRIDSHGEPVRGAMVCGHFLFGPAGIDREIPYDPHMFYVGDELPMALRYFTHGYNVYHPGICCVYHLYERAKILKEHGLSYEWPNCYEERGILKQWIEKKRIMKLYGIEDNDQNMTGFDLGRERTLREFEEFAGISLRKELIYEREGNECTNG